MIEGVAPRRLASLRLVSTVAVRLTSLTVCDLIARRHIGSEERFENG